MITSAHSDWTCHKESPLKNHLTGFSSYMYLNNATEETEAILDQSTIHLQQVGLKILHFRSILELKQKNASTVFSLEIFGKNMQLEIHFS